MGAIQFIRHNRWYDAAIPIVFILAFAGATSNHVVDLLKGGWFPYTQWYGAPASLNIYWTGLTVLDPLAIFAVLCHLRAGYVVALGIMLTDVPINLYANAHYWKLPLFQNSALMMQIAFLIFLLATCRRVWRLSGVPAPLSRRKH